MRIVDNLLLWGSMLWMPWLMYFVLKNETKPKKNIIVGTTLPYEAHTDPQVTAILDIFRRELKTASWLCMVPAVPCVFIESFGLSMTIWLIWVIAVCVVPVIPYVRCNKALRALKEQRGWRRRSDARAVVDLKAAAVEMKWLSPMLFLPPFLISLLPVVFDPEMWLLWLIMAAMVALFYVSYRYLYRNRAEMVDDNTERTLALTRIRRYNWGKTWLIMAWATGILNPLIWLTLDSFLWSSVVFLGYMAVVMWASMSIEFRVRDLQEKLCADSGQGDYVDEDDYWIWGMFYYNPNDKRLLANARVGMNGTVNLARKPGQIIAGATLLLLLACPLMGIWFMGMEKAPVELVVTETELVASHYGTEYVVALEDIQSAHRLEELPVIRRVSGAGMPNAKTGTWSGRDWGRVTCCVDPRTGPWLLVETTEGKRYLLNSTEEASTLAVWEQIRE